MSLIEYFPDGTLCFNWDFLPQNIKENIELRDKIFNEIEKKINIDQKINTKFLFDLNKYAMNRIQSELKKINIEF